MSADGLTVTQREDIAVSFRKRNVDFWWRLPMYGWTSTGPHGHGVVRDSAFPLSAGAVAQVRQYDQGLDGLKQSTAASRPYRGKDYHARPIQRPFVYGYPPPAPYPGRPIGWPSPRSCSSGPPVATIQRALRVPVTSLFNLATRNAVARWTLTHPGAALKDRVGLGAVGPALYASILTRYPA